ncbi:MAG: cytochrome c oxidase subunit II [Phycisphaerales bacterium]
MLYTLASSQSWHHKLIFRTPPGSETAAWSDGLFMMIFWFSAFFFVLLMGLMVYWTIKYRRRPGVPAPSSPHHNTPLEIIWTVVPSSALLVIFLFGFQGYLAKMVVPSQALELRVTGLKWAWDAVYPSGVRSTEQQRLEESEDGTLIGNDYPIIYVPENTAISLKMSSKDVIHAFWIPAFRSKIDVYPNRYTGYTFKTPSVGVDDFVYDNKQETDIPGIDMWVFCAEYCGDDHSRMAATIRVVSRDLYEQKLESFGDTGDPVLNGKNLHAGLCAVCHSVDGSPGTGPSWLDVYGSEGQMNDGSVVLKDDNYLRESILVPGAKIVAGYAGNMPSFQGQLKDEQLDWIIAYMKSISQYAPEPALIDGEPADGAPDAESTETQPSEVIDGGES